MRIWLKFIQNSAFHVSEVCTVDPWHFEYYGYQSSRPESVRNLLGGIDACTECTEMYIFLTL